MSPWPPARRADDAARHGLCVSERPGANRACGMARVSAYWDWRRGSPPQELWQFWDGTAPTHHLFGLRTALDMIAEEGMQQVWARHAALAQAIWAAVAAWGADGPMRLNLAEESLRSHAITAVHLPDGDAARLQTWCRDVLGLTLGYGLGAARRQTGSASAIWAT